MKGSVRARKGSERSVKEQGKGSGKGSAAGEGCVTSGNIGFS